MEIFISLVITIILQKYIISKFIEGYFGSKTIKVKVIQILSFLILYIIVTIFLISFNIDNSHNVELNEKLKERKINKEYFESNTKKILDEVEKNVLNKDFDNAIESLKKYKYSNATNYDFDKKINEIEQLKFKEKRTDILNELNTLYKNKEYQKGINLVDKYHNYLDKSFNEIRTKLILAKLKQIPTKSYSDIQMNYMMYDELVELNPSNVNYKNKMNFYKQKMDEIEAKEAAEKIFYGKKPIQSGWDGSYSEVKNYLSYAMKDPDSLDIRECSSVYKIDNVGWAVHCSYRGKNSFGAVVLNSNWFIIRNNRVVKVEPSSAYSIK